MRALRLRLRQSSANYKREETVDNKMTYPLPPISTVIGAIHAACGYRDYHPMDISIQGRYESMHREPYTDYCFLNSVQDDRGILVKMGNGSMLSTAYERVASAKKPQGNSFRSGVTIQVHNQELLDEYRRLKDINDEIGEFKKKRLLPALDLLKRRKKQLSEKKKKLEKGGSAYKRIEEREKELGKAEKLMKRRMEKYQQREYTLPISRYRSLTKSLKYYEILNQIELIIHIRTEDQTDLEEIYDCIYDMKSIGRSEDMVQIEEVKFVDLQEDYKGEVFSPWSAYIDCELVRTGRILFEHVRPGRRVGGTKYYLNKKYEIIDGKRKFDKKKVLYLSQYSAEQFGDGLYLDQDGGVKYIVNFL